MKKYIFLSAIAMLALSGCSNDPVTDAEIEETTRSASAEVADQETVTLPLQGEGDVNDSTK